MNNLRIIFIIIGIIITNYNYLYSQSSIGVIFGYNKPKFYKIKKTDDLNTIFSIGNGSSFGIIYSKVNNNRSNFGFNILFKKKLVPLEAKFSAGRSSYYKNLEYNIEKLGVAINYDYLIRGGNKLQVFIPFGAYFDYTIKATATGFGWNFVPKTFTTDTSVIHFIDINNWIIEDFKTKDISSMDVGLFSGINLKYTINKKIHAGLNFQYWLGLNKIAIQTAYLMSGDFNLIFLYKFNEGSLSSKD